MDRPFKAYTGDENYVFVSYSHADSPAVYKELRWLKQSGCNIWYDEGIEAGTEWREELAAAIRQSTLFVYFVTPASVASENCRKEVNFAVDAGIPIVAVHLEETDLPDGLRLTLSDRQAILKFEQPEANYRDKLQARAAFYLDQKITQPVATAANKTTPLLAAAAIALILTLGIGLFVYNQQTSQQPSEVTTESITTPPVADQASPTSASAAGAEIDLTAMRSIAVLPFANMSTSEETGFLAQGLSEDILSNLTQFQDLKVASRSASFQFAGRGVDPAEVSRKLGVAYLLEGSVRRQGDAFRITAQLIRTIDGFHVWSKSYEQPIAANFEQQSVVAANMVNIIESELRWDIYVNHQRQHDERFAGIDPVAVEHFVSAMDLDRNRALGEGGPRETYMQLLANAIEGDSAFLAAHYRLAEASLSAHNIGDLPLETARPVANEAIKKAQELDPNVAEVEWIQANINLSMNLDYAQSAQFFTQVVTLAPQYPWPPVLLAKIDLREGRTSAALKRLDAAESLDATNHLGVDRTTFLLYTSLLRCMAGDCERALANSAEALDLATEGTQRRNALANHIQSLLALDRFDQAKPLIDEAWRVEGAGDAESYSFFLARIGETEKARDILADSRYDLTHHFWLALGALALGDIDRTFAMIEAGIENHDNFLLDSLLVAQWWDPIRDDRRFTEMLALLDSKVTHTQQYLQGLDATQSEQ